MTIKTNDIIRSFDFRDTTTTGPRACFVEGRVSQVDGNAIQFQPRRSGFNGEDDSPEMVAERGTMTTHIQTWRGSRLDLGTLLVLPKSSQKFLIDEQVDIINSCF